MKTQSILGLGYKDIIASLKMHSLSTMLGWQDVKQRYRRSIIGPFWLTISIGIMVGSIGVVFGNIFKSNMSVYLPFLSAGVVIWSYIAASIGDGCNGFISAEAIIRQLPIPLFVHISRAIWRNFVILLHNLLILPLLYFIYSKKVGLELLLFFPGIFLLTINLSWIALLLAILSARFRDLPQVVGSLLQVLYFVTPIVWVPNLLTTSTFNLIQFNPMFHLIEIVRAPLLGEIATILNWQVSMTMALAGWLLAIAALGRYRWRIAYWV